MFVWVALLFDTVTYLYQSNIATPFELGVSVGALAVTAPLAVWAAVVLVPDARTMWRRTRAGGAKMSARLQAEGLLQPMPLHPSR